MEIAATGKQPKATYYGQSFFFWLGFTTLLCSGLYFVYDAVWLPGEARMVFRLTLLG